MHGDLLLRLGCDTPNVMDQVCKNKRESCCIEKDWDAECVDAALTACYDDFQYVSPICQSINTYPYPYKSVHSFPPKPTQYLAARSMSHCELESWLDARHLRYLATLFCFFFPSVNLPLSYLSLSKIMLAYVFVQDKMNAIKCPSRSKFLRYGLRFTLMTDMRMCRLFLLLSAYHSLYRCVWTCGMPVRQRSRSGSVWRASRLLPKGVG